MKKLKQMVKLCNDSLPEIAKLASFPISHFTLGDFDKGNKPEIIKIKLEPSGFRDVYWCWNLNEPFVVEYRDDKRYCPNCNTVDFDDDSHVFICSILKPKWHKTWDGVDEKDKNIYIFNSKK